MRISGDTCLQKPNLLDAHTNMSALYISISTLSRLLPTLIYCVWQISARSSKTLCRRPPRLQLFLPSFQLMQNLKFHAIFDNKWRKRLRRSTFVGLTRQRIGNTTILRSSKLFLFCSKFWFVLVLVFPGSLRTGWTNTSNSKPQRRPRLSTMRKDNRCR